MSKPNEGFDLDSYDFTEYASALDGENLSTTDCDMESERVYGHRLVAIKKGRPLLLP